MKIDGVVNYSSFMQHFHPLDVRDTAGSEQASVQKVQEVRETAPVGEDEGRITALNGTYNRAKAYETAPVAGPLEDIEVDFGNGSSAASSFETGEIRKAISDMEKDAVLHEYQYFVGNHRSETLVDNPDGIVTRLSDAVA